MREAMRRERVVEGELRAAVRGQGLRSLDEAEAVVLETDGSFSVVFRAELAGEKGSALSNVQGLPG